MVSGLRRLEYLDLSHSAVALLEASSLATPSAAPWRLDLQHTPLATLSRDAFGHGEGMIQDLHNYWG